MALVPNIYQEHLAGVKFITSLRNGIGVIKHVNCDMNGVPVGILTENLPYHIDAILIEYDGVEYHPIDYLRKIGVYKHDI